MVGEKAFQRLLEQNLLGSLAGGLFYTLASPTHDSDYAAARIQAVNLFSSAIQQLADEAIRVRPVLTSYEQMLLEHLDQVTPEHDAARKEIVSGIWANRVAMQAWKAQLEYDLTIRSDNAVVSAALKQNQFETIVAMVLQEETYVSWLMGATEIVHHLLQNANPALAETMQQTSAKWITESLSPAYHTLLDSHQTAARIHAYLLSADYFMGEYQLVRLAEKIQMLTPEETQDLSGAIQDYETLLQTDRTPAVLIDPETYASATASQSPFARLADAIAPVVHAESMLTDQSAVWISIRIFEELSDNPNLYRNQQAMADMLLTEILLDPGLPEVLADIKEQIDTSGNPDYGDRILQMYQLETDNHDVPPEEVDAVKQELAFLAESAESGTAREALIDRIAVGQDLLRGFSWVNPDFAYSEMISRLSELISERSNLSDSQIQNIQMLIQEDLAELVGDQREELISRLVNTSAEDILNQFDDWKRNTDNFQTLDLTRNDLIRLLNNFGFDLPVARPDPLPSIASVEGGMWELVETIEVIPSTYEAGDDKDHRLYTFEYSAEDATGSVACEYERKVYDGIKKTYLTETIATSGSWQRSSTDEAYVPGDTIRLTLQTRIDAFDRLTPAESGGNGTNFTGVAAWAYWGNVTTVFGNTGKDLLSSANGETVCRADIIDGMRAVESATLEVSGEFGEGKKGSQTVLFIVISNQGRVGGVKYLYEFVE
ncbi:MAG: hypothetical protein EOM08_11510 [Clostridia bacterium]|nr:hypothetical protein [Clostridia bacterium]